MRLSRLSLSLSFAPVRSAPLPLAQLAPLLICSLAPLFHWPIGQSASSSRRNCSMLCVCALPRSHTTFGRATRRHPQDRAAVRSLVLRRQDQICIWLRRPVRRLCSGFCCCGAAWCSVLVVGEDRTQPFRQTLSCNGPSCLAAAEQPPVDDHPTSRRSRSSYRFIRHVQPFVCASVATSRLNAPARLSVRLSAARTNTHSLSLCACYL